MAAFHGKTGSVTFNTAEVLNLISWSIEATAEISDASYMTSSAVSASTHWKDFKTGFLTWTATATGYYDSTSDFDPDLATDMKDEDGATLVLLAGLQADSVRKYSGTAFVTGISVNADSGSTETITYTFQGSGALTVAASDAT
jgi:hypothetical protein